MPKPKAKQSKKRTINFKKISIFTAIGAILVVGGYFAYAQIIRYNNAAKQAEIVSIRELVLHAVEGLKTAAPVDAKTGDIYFPQARVFLPAPVSGPLQITYNYEPATENSKELLTVSRKEILNNKTVPLYAAADLDDMFAAIPKLQSCQRGIAIAFEPNTLEGQTPKQSIVLANGKTAYMYLEENCAELNDTLLLLSNLRSY